ncbi:Der GTPase-activating protein YihI [Pseudoalteromonas sp. R3]|uniref:Der GTPase-activating protein YihI n=1 Tax=Pseudoalteromonas sp. R3 TaxID=1709477 RepID=UPI0006B581F5|nr:Der GTPase-activating protein YihI [Pseudoalteromonas sp. R3]AZZ99697.1 GTPase-activating protein [Pseudoalteromonas sp. R3]
MTRKKKSRKVGNIGTPRLSKEKLQELRALKEQRNKKHKGKKPGSRNAQEAKVEESKTSGSKKDPRAGSKKPVALVPQPQQASEPKLNRDLKPQVELKKVAPVTLTPEEELRQLENDERLMALLERHERGELLTGKDAKYFNKSVARHQELCELLGIDDEFEEADMPQEDELDQWMSNDLANEWLTDEDEER